MRRFRGVAAALLAALWLLAAPSLPVFCGMAETAHTVVYFFRNYCESCTPEEDFARQFKSLTGLSLSECDFTGWNTARADGQAALDAAFASLGLETAALPLAIADGVACQGPAQMNAELAGAALPWHETLDSEILFLYIPACESCADAEAAAPSCARRASSRSTWR